MRKAVPGLLMFGSAVFVGVAALRNPSTLSVAILFGMLLFYVLAFEFSMWMTNRSHATTEHALTAWGVSSMYAREVTAGFFMAVDRLSTYDREEAERLVDDVRAAAMKGQYDLNWMED